ncbi:MAG: hypothetical protein ACXU86_08635 [Archangium sp.]
MKKLLAALVVTLGTAALAQQADTNPQNAPAQQEPQGAEGRHISTGVDASDVAPEMNGAKSEAKQTENEAAAMNKAHAFNLNGTVKKAGHNGVTISRQGLPDADLAVRDQTQVMLNGKKVAVADIPEGSQVRAKFQLEGNDTVAVVLDATSPKGMAGSTKKGAKTEKKGGTKTETKTEKKTTTEEKGTTQPETQGTQPAPQQ